METSRVDEAYVFGVKRRKLLLLNDLVKVYAGISYVPGPGEFSMSGFLPRALGDGFGLFSVYVTGRLNLIFGVLLDRTLLTIRPTLSRSATYGTKPGVLDLTSSFNYFYNTVVVYPDKHSPFNFRLHNLL